MEYHSSYLAQDWDFPGCGTLGAKTRNVPDKPGQLSNLNHTIDYLGLSGLNLLGIPNDHHLPFPLRVAEVQCLGSKASRKEKAS